MANVTSNIPTIKIHVCSLEDDGGYVNPSQEYDDINKKNNMNKEPSVTYKAKKFEVGINNPRTNNRFNSSPLTGKVDSRNQNGHPLVESQMDTKYNYSDDKADDYSLFICCKRMKHKWRETSRARRRTIKTVLLAGFFVFSTVLGLVIYAHREYFTNLFNKRNIKICDTAECVKTAGDIMNSLDPKIDPCQNFYEFACGGWRRTHPIPPTEPRWDQFSKLHENIMFNVKRLLEQPPKKDELRAFKNARKMFKACTNEKSLNSAGVKPLVETLEKFGGIPMISEEWSEEDFDWIEVLAKLHKSLITDGFISLYITRDDKNTYKNVLYLDQGTLLDRPKSIAENDTETRELEKHIMEKSMELLYKQKQDIQIQGRDAYTTQNNVISKDPPFENTTVSTEQITTINSVIDQPGQETTESYVDNTTLPTPNISEASTNAPLKGSLKNGNRNASSINFEKVSSSNITLNNGMDENTSENDTLTSTNKTLNSDVNTKIPLENPNSFSDKSKAFTSSPSSSELGGNNLNENIQRKRYISPLVNSTTKPTNQNQMNEENKIEDENQEDSNVEKNIYKDMEDVWTFFVEIAKIMEHDPNVISDENKYNQMTIQELMDNSSHNEDKINWLRFFQILFDGSHVEITKNFKVIVRTPNYFRNLGHVIKKTSKRTIANTLLYTLVLEMGKEVSPKIASPFKAKSTEGDTMRYIGSDSLRPWFSCAQKVIYSMEHVVTYLYVKENYDEWKQDATTIGKMVESFQENLIATLNSTPWMDEETRKEALKKAQMMHSLVGFDQKYIDEIMIDTFYLHFPEMSESDHYSNMVYAKEYEAHMNLRDITTPPPTRNRWTINNLDANAYYSFTENAIQIPMGVFAQPIFRRNSTLSLLYGGIGTIIGHEIFHAFDSEGKSRDWKGILKDWWSSDSLEQFNKKSKCYEEIYNLMPITTNLTDKDGNIVKVDGERTKAENIADNEGISLSWKLYKSGKEQDERRLIGLDQYSSDQLFFIGFGQMWCGNAYSKELIESFKYGIHTPHRSRVHGVLRNSRSFAEVFQCTTDDPMVSDKTCSLW